MVWKMVGSQPGAAVEEGEGVLVGVGMHAGHSGGAEYGAGVTPRKTVLVGALARVALVDVAVLNE